MGWIPSLLQMRPDIKWGLKRVMLATSPDAVEEVCVYAEQFRVDGCSTAPHLTRGSAPGVIASLSCPPHR